MDSVVTITGILVGGLTLVCLTGIAWLAGVTFKSSKKIGGKFGLLVIYAQVLKAVGWLLIVLCPAVGAGVALKISEISIVVGILLGGILGLILGLPYMVTGEWMQVFIAVEQNTSEMLKEQHTSNELLSSMLASTNVDKQ